MFQKVMSIFTVFMILIYIGAGILILLTENSFFVGYPTYIKTLLGGTLVLYGVYRIIVFYTKLKKQKENEEENI